MVDPRRVHKAKPMLRRTPRQGSANSIAGHGRGFAVWLTALIATTVLRLAYATWSKDTAEIEKLDRLSGMGSRVMVVFWHGKYFPLFALTAGRQACIFSSASFRGEVIAEICRRFGFNGIVLPEVGSRRLRTAMVDAMRDHSTAALIVDGPLGPRHRVKRGALDVCSDLGFVILPISAAARRKWVMERRWDKREIPKLFTRVAVTVGEPISVPARLASADVRELKTRIHDELEALDRRATEKVNPGTSFRSPRHDVTLVAADERGKRKP